MGFFVVGINHKTCPVEVREKLHFTAAALETGLSWIKTRPEVAELVILSTCNRVEFYGWVESPTESEESVARLIENVHGLNRAAFTPYLYHHADQDAIRHLFRVASGLDSLVVGENEILGQLREAFRAANEAGTVHALLYRLMEKALKVGKDVRTQTKINEGAVSIPSAAVELAEKIFGHLAGEKVMVLGTGEMSTLTLKNLKSAGATVSFIASNSEERGRKLAGECAAEWIPLDQMEIKMPLVDIFIAATACPHPIVKLEQVKRLMHTRPKPLFLIDIAVPRNVEAEVNTLDDVYLYNVDDLKGVADANLKRRSRDVQAAEALIEKAVLDYRGWLEQLKARPTLERFEAFLDGILERELDRFAKESHATAEQKTELRNRIRAKLLHPPLTKIKEASQNGGVTRYLEALHSLFDLDQKS